MIRQITNEEFFKGYSPEQIFVTSDLHLYHTNIIKYCNRPFEYSPKGCAEMNEFILTKFDAPAPKEQTSKISTHANDANGVYELPEDCVIWNFGDVYLDLLLEESKIMNDIRRMKKNRKMNLILGNHDLRVRKKPFPHHVEYFKHLGFDEVYKGPLQLGRLIFSHEPVFIDSKSDFVNIHGHTHDKFVTEDYFLNDSNNEYPKRKVNPEQYINVCMDANEFKILNWKEILGKIKI